MCFILSFHVCGNVIFRRMVYFSNLLFISCLKIWFLSVDSMRSPEADIGAVRRGWVRSEPAAPAMANHNRQRRVRGFRCADGGLFVLILARIGGARAGERGRGGIAGKGSNRNLLEASHEKKERETGKGRNCAFLFWLPAGGALLWHEKCKAVRNWNWFLGLLQVVSWRRHVLRF